MFNEIIDCKNQKRRKDSMVKNLFGKIKYLLVLAVFLGVPSFAGAGLPSPDPIFDGASQIYFFWDLRDRKSFFQVTNVDTGTIFIHVQIFNSFTNCKESDFFDTLTGQDTHLYNLSAIDSNDGLLTGPPVFNVTDFGFVVVTVVDAHQKPATATLENALIGTSRIIDTKGKYEYRTNAAEWFIDTVTFSVAAFNFNTGRGENLSDVVGIPVANSGTSDVLAGSPVFIAFEPTVYNDSENPSSCPPLAFACALDSAILSELQAVLGTTFTVGFDVGINNFFVNSKGADSLCNQSDKNGWVRLDGIVADADFFVGFVGLNNGNGSGSMDPFWTSPGLVSNQITGTAIPHTR
jgi:hypothetical protein